MIRHVGNVDSQRPVIEVFEITDPQELEQARLQRTQYDRNSQWLQEHFEEIYTPATRGKFICISGQEAFIGDTNEDVVARATAAHPDDKGYFTRYVPRQKMTWIYAIKR
jgi:hypothetical protein